jgi:phosphonate transport system substrate-binding protein
MVGRLFDLDSGKCEELGAGRKTTSCQKIYITFFATSAESCMSSRYYFIFLSIILSACSPGEDVDAPVPVREPDAPSVDGRPVIRFGVVSRNNPILMYRSYQPIMDYLSAHTPYRFELKLGKSYRNAVELLENGETDMAYLDGVTYLMAHEQFGALPLVKSLNEEGEPFYRSVFIVRKDSPLRDLADLKGHSLALGSGYSTSGNLIPRCELARIGIVLEGLEEFAYLPHHNLVARKVLEGEFDAGVVKDAVARKYKEKGLRFLFFSEPIPSHPLTVRPDLSDSVKQAVVEVMLGLSSVDGEQREEMEGWDEEFRYGFVPASDADYEPLRQKMNELPGGCSQGCHGQRSF